MASEKSFIELAGNAAIAKEFEDQALSIGDEFLPEIARRVRDRDIADSEDVSEYWRWLSGQWVAGKVTIEIMPQCWRDSHKQAGNWGLYPANGAEHIEVSPEEAKQLLEEDYAHIVGADRIRAIAADIYEQGNGLPDVGDYVSDGDDLFEIITIAGNIQTDSPRGNYVGATVKRVAWDACAEEDQHTARVVLK